MKSFYIALSFLLPVFAFSQFNPSQNDQYYQVELDLTQIVEDRIKVEVVVPVLSIDDAVYNMPVMVPGTYKIYNFGRFVHDLIAIGGRGDTLETEQLNENQWQIAQSKDLYKLVYWVSDTYDGKGSNIFAPAGTGISEEAFMLNNFGFVGFIEGAKDLEFELSVRKPSYLTATTSLPRMSTSDSLEVFRSDDYFHLHDCPILYASPDTASIEIAGAEIRIGVYSPEGNINATEILEALTPVFEAAADYLGGELPTELYTVMVYGVNMSNIATGIGALEHHTSTVVNIPDISEKYMKMVAGEGGLMQIMRDIVSHEFFHIVTPLSIHSEQISNFDFMNPKMSMHLWLYEGVTEYNANISQTRYGILTEGQFFMNMREKMKNARSFNEDIPFTVSSKYALDVFEDQYLNVYEKGALVGMCLDLTLLIETNGEYGLADLLNELSQTYGEDTFFVDEHLFDIIYEITESDRVRAFFAKYVEGAEPLPLAKLLDRVGYIYIAEKRETFISDGGLEFDLKDGAIVVTRYRKNDPFIASLGIRRGDQLLVWNKKKITEDNLVDVMADFSANAKVGQTVNVVVNRNFAGKYKKTKLSAQVQYYESVKKDVLVKKENPSQEEIDLLNIWLNQGVTNKD